MSDDNNSHYRTNDPYGQPAAQNDPLAELARLIGQNDPFSEFGRDSRAPAPQERQQETHYAEPAPPRETSYDHHPAQADWQNPTPAAPAYDPFAQSVHQQHQHPAARAPEPQYDSAPYHDPHAQPAPEPYQTEAAPYGAPHAAYEAPAYGQDAPAYGQAQAAPAYSHGAADGQRYDQAAYAQAAFQQPAFPPDAAPQAAPSDEYYDDAPPEGRRKGLITVVAVLGLAVVGTAGAFGYRSVFGNSPSSSSSTPPVIRASAEPSKVAPPPQASNDSAAKLSYDRFGDRSQNEQVKVREEQPLDIKELAARAIASQSSAPAVSNVTTVAPAGGTNPPSVLTEPRRVRTLQIHPDQQEAVSPRQPLPQPVTAAPAAQPPAPRPTTVASATPPAAANQPTNIAPDAPPKAAAPHVVRTASVPRVQASEPPAANAPLSLSPDGNTGLPAPAAPQLASTRSAPRVAAVAPTAATAGNGHFLVQVSSQRSEADAQSSYRSIQAKYGSVLGDRSPVIRKADLGTKGTYYRAMVGPFASRADAISLCGSLKAAGGDCVVQGN